MDFYSGDPPPTTPAGVSGTGPGGGAGTAGSFAGVSGTAGASGSGVGGAGVAGAGVAGAGVAGAAGSAGTPGDGRCQETAQLPQGAQSFTFDTAGPICIRVQQDIQGWGCSNANDRTITVNGMVMPTCGAPLPAKVSGSYYFSATAGMFSYAQIYWF